MRRLFARSSDVHTNEYVALVIGVPIFTEGLRQIFEIKCPKHTILLPSLAVVVEQGLPL